MAAVVEVLERVRVKPSPASRISPIVGGICDLMLTDAKRLAANRRQAAIPTIRKNRTSLSVIAALPVWTETRGTSSDQTSNEDGHATEGMHAREP